MKKTRPPIESWFTITKQRWICNTEVEVLIPSRYMALDLYRESEDVHSLGVFELRVLQEGFSYGLMFPAILTMSPTSVDTRIESNISYKVAKFNNGDIFLKSLDVIKQGFIAAKMFTEISVNGHYPAFLTYNAAAGVYDNVDKICGINLGVPRAVLEMIVAKCARDPDNINQEYRFSNFKKPPVYIGIKNVAIGTDTTTAKVVGSYMSEGINSVIVRPTRQSQELENLLRI